MKLEIYEAIGGRAKLNEAVSLFYENVLADPQLRPFFSHADMDGLRAKQSMFLTMLLGGIDSLGRPDVRRAHTEPRKQGLTDAHVTSFFTHFRAALEDIGTAPRIMDRVMEKLEASRGEVLNQ